MNLPINSDCMSADDDGIHVMGDEEKTRIGKPHFPEEGGNNQARNQIKLSHIMFIMLSINVVYVIYMYVVGVWLNQFAKLEKKSFLILIVPCY